MITLIHKFTITTTTITSNQRRSLLLISRRVLSTTTNSKKDVDCPGASLSRSLPASASFWNNVISYYHPSFTFNTYQRRYKSINRDDDDDNDKKETSHSSSTDPILRKHHEEAGITTTEGSGDMNKKKQEEPLSKHQNYDSSWQHKILHSTADSLNLSPATKNQMQAIWTQSQSLPNQITVARICSTPLLCHFITSNQYKLAISGCILAGISDVLDGYIARKYNQKTILGTYLDPLADKIFINSIALSLSYSHILPWWCTGLWLGRDVILIGMAYRTAAIASKGSGNNVADPSSTPLKIKPSMISKVNTLFQFCTIWTGLGCAALGYQDVVFSSLVLVHDQHLSISPMDGLCIATCGTTILSGVGYLDGKAMKKRKDMQS